MTTEVVILAVALISALSGLAAGYVFGCSLTHVRDQWYDKTVDTNKPPANGHAAKRGVITFPDPPRKSSAVLRGKR